MSKAVELQNFSYKYPDGTAGLTDVSIAIEHGQKVAIIGANGAGKSTMLLAISGLIKGAGEVFIDGLKLTKNNLKKIRSLIGCCLENPDEQLFMPVLFDDVAFGPLNMGLDTEQVKARVKQALTTVGLSNMADKAPHHLSAGQKRAAAIATVLSMSPKIIALDEPDGSLDPANRSKLEKLLSGLSQTLIIATCNMNFAASLADRAVLVDDGRIVADGSAEQILSNSQLMTDHKLELPYKFKRRSG